MKYSLRSLMPKRSWFQFSLKTLFVLLTAAALLLGWRLDFLRRKVAFHRSEMDRCYVEKERLEKVLLKRIEILMETDDKYAPPPLDVMTKRQAEKDVAYADFHRELASFKLHRELEVKYSRAVYRPWTIVREPKP
jgi:hypothetical protein